MKSSGDKRKFVRLERAVVEEVSSFLFALGNQFVDVKNAQGAFDCFKYSLDIHPKQQAATYNIGVLYNILGNQEGAERMFREALRMAPTNDTTKVALAEILRKRGKIDEALSILKEVQAVDPENYMMIAAMAIIHYDQGRLAEAFDWNERALAQRPYDTHSRLNAALISMIYGKWPENWATYEQCLSYQANEKMKGLRPQDAWNGTPCPGATLLVVSDQGAGDAIEFSRFLPEAKQLGQFAKLVYLVQPDQVDLLSRVDGVDEAIGFGERLSVNYQAFSPLLGIMRVLQVSPDNCFRPPNIVTNNPLDDSWRARIAAQWDGRSKRVGIVWAGDPKHGADQMRSLSLKHFVRLLAVQGIQLFSFQVGGAARQLDVLAELGLDGAVPPINLGEDFRNYDDTASAINQMHLMVTCDTSVGHLAGCMGVPTWWLISNPPEWRHLFDRSDSPWYRDARIFRQRDPGKWEPVIDAVRDELGEWVRA